MTGALAKYETFREPAILGGLSALPVSVRTTANKNYELLKADPRHPSLHFKKVGNFCSVRVGRGHRALAVEIEDGLLWFWIGSHKEYDELVK